MTAEEWRPIPGFPGYEVSNLGRILSRQRYHGSTEPRILRTPVGDWGYPFVHLRADDGSSPTIKVHTAVMRAFVGERPDDAVVRHLDGDPTNNAVENLRYGTASENSFDQVTHGTHPYASRTHCKHDHEYTPENTAIWTSSRGRPFRSCKTCHRAKMERHRIAKRAAKKAAA